MKNSHNRWHSDSWILKELEQYFYNSFIQNLYFNSIQKFLFNIKFVYVTRKRKIITMKYKKLKMPLFFVNMKHFDFLSYLYTIILLKRKNKQVLLWSIKVFSYIILKRMKMLVFQKLFVYLYLVLIYIMKMFENWKVS